MSSLSDEDRANLTAYLDGELDEAASQALEAKLSQDPQARAEADALQQAWGLLDYLPKPEPSASFTHRTLERLSLEMKPSTGKMPAAGRRVRWATGLAWAAAVLAAVGAGVGAGYLLGRQGHDGTPDRDEPMIHHLRVAEKWRYYEPVEDLEFLRGLDHPDLFGEEDG
jgi:anti-sigma factor RsiW